MIWLLTKPFNQRRTGDNILSAQADQVVSIVAVIKLDQIYGAEGGACNYFVRFGIPNSLHIQPLREIDLIHRCLATK